MHDQIIGSCSICGGPVQCPLVYWSIVPPVPTCGQCGAVAASHGPVIEMRPARYQTVTTTGTGNIPIKVNDGS